MRAFFILWVVAACGGKTNGDTDGGGSLLPPDSGVAPETICSTCSTFTVMKTAFLGDTTRTTASPSTTAWKDFGEDIDGKATAYQSTDVCTRTPGAPTSVQQDGNLGIDNSFGANIVPIIQSAGSIISPSGQFTTGIATGKAHSLLVALAIKGGTASFELSVGAPLGKPALFDGTDLWSPSAFTTSSLGATLTDFQPTFRKESDGSFTFHSGRSAQRILLLLHMGLGAALPIPIDRLQITMKVRGGSLQPSSGTISGVIPTEVFIAAFRQMAGGISKSLCGSAFDGIAQQLRETQDILHDGTNVSGAACDGISFGMGFEPSPAQLATPMPETPIMQTCP